MLQCWSKHAARALSRGDLSAILLISTTLFFVLSPSGLLFAILCAAVFTSLFLSEFASPSASSEGPRSRVLSRRGRLFERVIEDKEDEGVGVDVPSPRSRKERGQQEHQHIFFDSDSDSDSSDDEQEQQEGKEQHHEEKKENDRSAHNHSGKSHQHQQQLALRCRKTCTCQLCNGGLSVLKKLGAGSFGSAFLVRREDEALGRRLGRESGILQSPKSAEGSGKRRRGSRLSGDSDDNNSNEEAGQGNGESVLKVLKLVRCMDTEDANEALNEATTIASLRHPGVVRPDSIFLHFAHTPEDFPAVGEDEVVCIWWYLCLNSSLYLCCSSVL